MSKKKPAPRKHTENQLASARAAREQEIKMLRHAKRQQETIVDLSRAVRRACVRADAARIQAARDLVEGSEWGVFGVEEIDRRARELESAREHIAALRAELDAANAELLESAERYQQLCAERDDLRERAAAHA